MICEIVGIDRRVRRTRHEGRKFMEDTKIITANLGTQDMMTQCAEDMQGLGWNIIGEVNIALAMIEMRIDGAVRDGRPIAVSSEARTALKDLYIAAHHLQVNLDELNQHLNIIANNAHIDLRDEEEDE